MNLMMGYIECEVVSLVVLFDYLLFVECIVWLLCFVWCSYVFIFGFGEIGMLLEVWLLVCVECLILDGIGGDYLLIVNLIFGDCEYL